MLIYIHKEQKLDDVERRYPAEHYVLVDDKLRILAAVKESWGDARDHRVPAPGALRARPAMRWRRTRRRTSRSSAIGDLLGLALEDFLNVR